MYKFSQVKKLVSSFEGVTYITDRDDNNHNYISVRFPNETQVVITKLGRSGGLLVEQFDNGTLVSYEDVNTQAEVLDILQDIRATVEAEKLIGTAVKFDNQIGTIYDITKCGNTVWVETSEGIYETKAENVEIMRQDVPTSQYPNHSASIEFRKWTWESKEKRYLDAFVVVKGEHAEQVHDRLVEIMNEYIDLEFQRCPVREENYYCDATIVEYEHGLMAEMKSDIKYAFKMAKKELGIR